MTLRLSPSAARRMGLTAPRGNKYRAVRTGGFDSRKEARRWQELRALELAKEIRDVRCQPEFHCWIHGQLVCKYRADFLWTDVQTGQTMIEDVKGYRTDVYRLKAKLVRALFGVTVRES